MTDCLIIGFNDSDFSEYVQMVGSSFFRAQLWYADPVTPIWERRDVYGVKGSAGSDAVSSLAGEVFNF